MTERELLDLDQLELAAPLIRVAAHPLRLRIIDFLRQGDACVGDIADVCQASQAVTSQHLSTLRSAGVLAAERQGQRVYYKLVRVELVRLLDCIREHCRLHEEEGS